MDNRQSGGMSVCGVLTVIFVVLKLVGVNPIATWSWWWVLSPLWIPFALVVITILLMAIIESLS